MRNDAKMKAIQIAWESEIKVLGDGLNWSGSVKKRPFGLLDDDKEHLKRLGKDGQGIYVFARKHSGRYVPLYIGQVQSKGKRNILNRVEEHLFRSEHSKELRKHLRKIKHPRGAKRGKKLYLLVGLVPKETADISRVLDLLESVLIIDALAYKRGRHKSELFNKQLRYQFDSTGYADVNNGIKRTFPGCF